MKKSIRRSGRKKAVKSRSRKSSRGRAKKSSKTSSKKSTRGRAKKSTRGRAKKSSKKSTRGRANTSTQTHTKDSGSHRKVQLLESEKSRDRETINSLKDSVNRLKRSLRGVSEKKDDIINTEKLKEVTKKSMDNIGGYLKNTGEKIKNVAGVVVEKVKSTAQIATEKIKEQAKPLIKKVESVVEPVLSAKPAVNKEEWELFTMDGCTWCDEAKKFLEARVNLDPENISLKIAKGAESTDKDVTARLSQYGDTWPKIFLNGKFIGGYSNL